MRTGLVLIAFIMLGAHPLFAQVEVNEQLQMTGATNASKRITNAGNPTAADHAVNVSTIQNNVLSYAAAAGSNSITVDLAPAVAAYVPGMMVHFKAAGTNTGPATLDVNSLGAVSIKKSVSLNLDSADIRTGQMVSLIYDGTNFQLMSQPRRSCPLGFADVNARYCIQQVPSVSATFFEAAKTCGDLNTRLCTWGEWYKACSDSLNLGMSGYFTNFEWVDSAANSGGDAKVAGYKKGDNINIAGSGGCMNSYSLPANNATWRSNYRCCFSKQ